MYLTATQQNVLWMAIRFNLSWVQFSSDTSSLLLSQIKIRSSDVLQYYMVIAVIKQCILVIFYCYDKA